MDGSFKLTESFAIHDYVADKWCPALKGTTPQHRAQVNMMANVIKDLKSGITGPSYGGMMDKIEEAIAKMLPAIVSFLGEKKFLVGNSPTWVDFYFFELVNLMFYLKQDLFTLYPVLEKYVKSMHSLPKLGAYLADPKCFDKNLPFNNKMAKFGATV